eukprot:5109381-Pyramimonas_sp.AAC.1
MGDGGKRQRCSTRKSQKWCTDGKALSMSKRAPPAASELSNACHIIKRPSNSIILPGRERPDIKPRCT